MKTITTNAREENALSMFHLFQFTLSDTDGTLAEVLYFTDHDIFVTYDGNEYTPLSISFDRLTEDVSMQTNSITVTLDNINSAISEAALGYEWRQNPATIQRVMYVPDSETISGEVYDFGYGDNLGLGTYPELILDDVVSKDIYTLFSGYISAFSATQQSLTGTISTKFIHWQKPFPSRTYDQKEFNSIINSMSNTVYWGRNET